MYPNITQEMATKAVELAISHTNMDIQNINNEALTKYVGITVDRERLRELNLSQFVPTPAARTTLNSHLKYPKESQFTPARKQIPNMRVRNKILGLAIGVMTKTTMSNHYYQINENVYKQLDGSAIGNDLAGEVARVFMLQWDKYFLKKLKKIGISLTMFKRYVDDLILALLQLKLKTTLSISFLFNLPLFFVST